MLRRKDHTKVSTILMLGTGAFLLGIFMFVLGLFGSVFTGTGGMVFAGVGGLIGITGSIMMVSCLFYGIKQERGDRRETKIVSVPDSQITARFAINHIGETIFDSDYIEFDNPKTKFYVRISAPGHSSLELRTTPNVWSVCGEGMRGISHVQGDWLGRFEHIQGPPPSGNPYLK